MFDVDRAKTEFIYKPCSCWFFHKKLHCSKYFSVDFLKTVPCTFVLWSNFRMYKIHRMVDAQYSLLIENMDNSHGWIKVSNKAQPGRLLMALLMFAMNLHICWNNLFCKMVRIIPPTSQIYFGLHVSNIYAEGKFSTRIRRSCQGKGWYHLRPSRSLRMWLLAGFRWTVRWQTGWCLVQTGFPWLLTFL